MNGKCDLIVPSVKSITMNLQEESTIKFIENSSMKNIKLKGKIRKVDLTDTKVRDVII